MEGGKLTVCNEQENKKYRISLTKAREVLSGKILKDAHQNGRDG